jgi:hypothetical protein
MRRLAAPSLLSLIVILFYWKLVLSNQYTWLESPDLVNQVLPWFQFQAGEWHRWRIPLWDPTSWYGQPLFGSGLAAPAYPLNWLLFWSPLRDGWLQQGYLHWYYVVARIVAALSAYALCRELGRSRAAAILGGCLFALGGFVGDTDWPQIVNGAITAPLVFLFLVRAGRTGLFRDAALSGFFMGFGWLSGHHQVNLLISLAAAGLWFWVFLRHRPPDWRTLRLAAWAGAIAILASGLQTVPMAEYGLRAVRWIGLADPLALDQVVPYSIHRQYSLPPIGLLGVFLPNVVVGSNPYVGVAGLTLAILGSILAWRERQVRWLVVIALGGMLYALGYHSVFHGVLYALAPMVDKARTPSAGTLVFAVGIAPLAAFGMDALSRPESAAWSRRAGRALLGLAAVLATASLIFFAATIRVEIYDHRMMIAAFAAAAAAAIFAAWRAAAISPAAGSAALLGIVLLELGNQTGYQFPNRMVPEYQSRLRSLSEHSALAAFLRARPGPARSEYDDQRIPYNFGAWYGLETYLATVTAVPQDLWRLDLFSPRSRDFFGVRYTISDKPNRPDQRELFKDPGGLNVYENPGAFPRAFAVHRAIVEPDLELLRARFADPAVDLRRTALLSAEPRPALQDCPGRDQVDLRLHAPNLVLIQARIPCRGLVVLTDNFYPGWSATVDGRASPILRVNGAVRGVLVEAGSHEIRMRYRPWSVGLGALMTLAATLIVAAAALRSGRRDRAVHRQVVPPERT